MNSASNTGITREFDWPPFASLPEFRPNLQTLEKWAIVGFGARDLRARPFALLRSQFQRRIRREGARLIGITSAAPHAGKSFVSLNLAGALAKVSEDPVHLVDLDFRRASLAEQLGLEIELGITDLLRNPAIRIQDLGWRVAGLNLAVYPTRTMDEGTAEALAGEPFARLIAGFRALPAGSIVLFDLPPVFVGDDAMIALEKLDGFIMVVDGGKTTAREVTESLQLLEPTLCFGTILNRYNGGLVGQYDYGYDYGKAERG